MRLMTERLWESGRYTGSTSQHVIKNLRSSGSGSPKRMHLEDGNYLIWNTDQGEQKALRTESPPRHRLYTSLGVDNEVWF